MNLRHDFGHTVMVFQDTDYALIEYTVRDDPEVHWIICPEHWHYVLAMTRLYEDPTVESTTQLFNC